MKRYIVTVNGKKYEVEIEEANGEFTGQYTQPVVQTVQPTQVAQPVAQQVVETKVATSGEGEAVESPMPGNIMSVNVTVGQQVKSGDVLFILEAMKMENEIMAGRDGVISSISVAKGATVDTGDALAFIK